MNTAHPKPELLAAYADGSLSDGMSLLVASHLTFCPPCRKAVARLEALGGALLAEAEPVAPVAASLAATLARLDHEEPELSVPAAGDAVLPAPLRARVGVGVGEIRWRFLLPGLSECKLEGFADEDVGLIRARPGVRIMAHTHSGNEATLVLSGQLRDADRVFGRGDVAMADHHDDHRPEIVGSEVCICLAVLSGRMRFTGPLGRAINLLRG